MHKKPANRATFPASPRQRRSIRQTICATIAVVAVSVGSAAVATAEPAVAATGDYVDVSDGEWYANPVKWGVNTGILDAGVEFFQPDAAVPRVTAAVWMWRSRQRPAADGQHPFTDVATDNEAGRAVSWLVDAGVTTGATDTTFDPQGFLTRGQTAALLWRLAGRPETRPHGFTDVQQPWQQQPVSWMTATGLTTGTSASTFSPSVTLTRAQLITFLYRYQQTRSNPTAALESDSEPEQDGDTDAASRQPVEIIVQRQAPNGVCAGEISKGVYQWEQCAWVAYREDNEHHKALSNPEADELIARIWAEVDVEGKPAAPPTSELVPAGSQCAATTTTGVTIGCYQPATHHIRRLDSFNDTLLHEVAHALVAGHPSLADCADAVSNDAYQACVHNDIFRCVADYLYVTYAGIATAGVCGTAQTIDTATVEGSGWKLQSGSSGTLYAYTDTVYHTRAWPYRDDWASLVVRCGDTGRFEVYLSVESGFLAGQYRHNGKIPVRSLFAPADFLSWTVEQQNSHFASNAVVGYFGESTTKRGAFMPDGDAANFPTDIEGRELLVLAVTNFDNSTFGVFAFNVSGAATSVAAVAAECGLNGSDTPPLTSLWETGRFNDGSRYASVEAVYHDRAWPYENTWASMVVTCGYDGLLDVYFVVESGFLAGQYRHNDKIPVAYMFTPRDYSTWDKARADAYRSENLVLSYWHESTTNDSAFAAESDVAALANGLAFEEQFTIQVYNFDDQPFGFFVFDVSGGYQHIRTISEACGWTWTS